MGFCALGPSFPPPYPPCPPCRVCKKVEPVLVYEDTDLQWTICPDCCEKATHPNGETGHLWEHDRHEKDYLCEWCGIARRHTNHVEGCE
jgi:hypothetical protein